MANRTKEVMSTYLKAMASLDEILSSYETTEAERQAAEQSVKDLTTALGVYNIQKVAERTALLNALIVELGEVTAAAKAGSKIQQTLTAIEGHVQKAKDLAKIAKEELETS